MDWARAAGFTVVAAGKGTKYLPAYHASTPQTVWGHYGFSDETVAKGDFNAQMFNSFLDGTKSGIEMAAVANATGPHARARRARVSAVRRRRPAARAAARAPPAARCTTRAGRGGLEPRARRQRRCSATCAGACT